MISLISMILPNDPPNLSWQSPIVSNIPWVESTPSTVWKCACVRTFPVFIPYPSRFGPGAWIKSSSTHPNTHSCTLWLHWRLISSSHTLWYMWYTIPIYGNVLYHSDRPRCKGGPVEFPYWTSSSTSWSDDLEWPPIPLSLENNMCTTQNFFPKTYLRIFLVTK